MNKYKDTMNVFAHIAARHTSLKKGAYSVYDNTNDARYESLRNYPKRIGLYKRHLDLQKEYEQKLRRYKKDQRLFLVENTHQKQKVEARFSKLQKQVINSRPYNLRYSYNWDAGFLQFSRAQTRESTKVFDTDQNDFYARDDLQHAPIQRTDDRLSPDRRGGSRTGHISPERPLERLRSHRSISVDNIPQVEENVYERTEKPDGGVIYIKSDIRNVDPSITRSLTSLVDHKKKTKIIEVQAIR